MYNISLKDRSEFMVSKEHKVYFSIQDSSDEQNSSMNSFVVNTLTNGCCLRCGSFDQTGQFNLNANAIKSISFLCGIESPLCKNSLYSLIGTNSTHIAMSLNNSLNFSLEIPVFSNICSEFLLISAKDNSGAKKVKSWSTSSPLINESFQKNVNSIFESTTNSIYINPFSFNLSYLPALEALCNLTDQSIISFSSSKCFISLLTNKDIPNFSTSSFNSSGNLMHISAMQDAKESDYKKLSVDVDEIISNVIQDKEESE